MSQLLNRFLPGERIAEAGRTLGALRMLRARPALAPLGGTLPVARAPVCPLLLADPTHTATHAPAPWTHPGFVNEANAFPRQLLAFVVDGVSIIIGSLLGCAPLTTYIESASGIREGGRTGLTAVVVRRRWVGRGGGTALRACLRNAGLPANPLHDSLPTRPQTSLGYFLALFFTPLIVSIPPYASGPALVVVGALMMEVGDGGPRSLRGLGCVCGGSKAGPMGLRAACVRCSSEAARVMTAALERGNRRTPRLAAPSPPCCHAARASLTSSGAVHGRRSRLSLRSRSCL
jgi:hypothetical protein